MPTKKAATSSMVSMKRSIRLRGAVSDGDVVGSMVTAAPRVSLPLKGGGSGWGSMVTNPFKRRSAHFADPHLIPPPFRGRKTMLRRRGQKPRLSIRCVEFLQRVLEFFHRHFRVAAGLLDVRRPGVD